MSYVLHKIYIPENEKGHFEEYVVLLSHIKYFTSIIHCMCFVFPVPADVIPDDFVSTLFPNTVLCNKSKFLMRVR